MNTPLSTKLPNIALLYLDHVLRFFDPSNFKGWPDNIGAVVYHWGKDKQRFIDEVKRQQIEVLIGNIPATAYEIFREIARALPEVRFVPSLDSQFANKSKENVTRLCEKYQLPIPSTDIFYDLHAAQQFLAHCRYPKIIKKSYGPSNYGGYYVHKVDDYHQAIALLAEQHYHPIYIQDFIPMAADIRVMLIGHQPVCAFWRRPPEGGWLTNTSQGGSMDYQAVPRAVLDLAVTTSKAANAQYWACDVAVGQDGQYRLLECATAFAAFPYIRDWIGQYLMWQLSNGRFAKPYIPLYHWEQLGKIDSSLLRTMRYITFGRQQVAAINDSAETFCTMSEQDYPLLDTKQGSVEEWPSELWNRCASRSRNRPKPEPCPIADIGTEALGAELSIDEGLVSQPELAQLTERHLVQFLAGVKGIGQKLTERIINTLGTIGVIDALLNQPDKLLAVKNIKDKKLFSITEYWEIYRKTL